MAAFLAAPAALARAEQSFTQVGVLPDNGYYAQSLEAASGYLFQTGGISQVNGIYDGDKVYRARILSPGQLGAWTAAEPLPVLIFYHASAVWNGTLYVIGGYEYQPDGSFVISNAVYYSRIQTDGSLGAWIRSANLPKSLYLHSAAVWNGTIYVSGGWSDDGQVSGVYGGTIGADGTVASWTPLTPLPAGVYAHTAVQDATLYVLGGVVENGARMQNNVYYSRIRPDRTLEAWQQTSPLPQPIANHVSEVIQGSIWSAGGWVGDAPSTRVDRAPILADKSLGSWTAGPALPVPVFEHASAVADDALYVTGGLDENNNVRSESWCLLPPPPSEAPDQLPPRTTLTTGGPHFGTSPLFVSRHTTFSLAAVDDRAAVGDGLGVGVASTQWARATQAFTGYAGPFSLSDEGAYLLRYFSTDTAGHGESEQSVSLALDATAPSSSLAVGSPKAVLANGQMIVAAATPLAVSGNDPVTAGVASGIADVQAGIDDGALSSTTGPFTLPAADGAHTVRHQARDQVGNLEALSADTLYVDRTPPATTLTADPAAYASADGPILGATGLLRFTAQDPVAGGVAAGVNHTEYALDGGAPATVTGSLALSEGVHVVQYRSVDNVGNSEAWRAAQYRLDATAPATTLTVGSPVMRVNGQDVVTPNTPLSLSAADATVAGVASGVRSSVYRVDAAAEQPYAAPFKLTAGTHVVYYRSTDNAGNAEPERSVTFDVQAMDALSPRTSHAVSGPQYGSDPVFIAASATLALTAIDDRSAVGDAAGVGVATTSWAFDALAFARYSAALPALAEGSHWFRYFSADQAGNVEAAHAVQVAVDATLPVSAIAIGQPNATLANGQVIVASSTWLSASASDPAAAGVASGVADRKVGLDSAPLASLTGLFRLPAADGSHAVRSQAVDRVGNTEAVRSLTVLLDQTPPLSTLTPSIAPYNGTILNGSAVLTFGASDPVAGAVAAGVNHTEYALDGSAAVTVTGTLVLAEGSHALLYRSVDNVGNTESWRQASYAVDATAPATALIVGSPVMRVDGQDVVTTDTPLSLAAQDPTVAGVASGVASTVFHVDSGSDQPYAAPFKLAAGTHVVYYRSTDNAGNAEAQRSASFSVQAMDSLPPRTAALIQGPAYGSNPVFVSAASAFSLSAVDDRQAVGDAAGVGVATTSWAFDAQAFAVNHGTVAAPAEGSHWLRTFSADRAGNTEAAQALSIAVDATRPASSVAVGAPRAVLASGETVISSYTLLSVSAQDPSSAGVASGVQDLLVAIDAAPLAPVSGSFALGGPDGLRSVRAQAIDHVGNAEAAQTTSLRVDQSAPATTLTPTVAPYADAGGPILGASAQLVFAAQDPVVNGTASGLSRTEYTLDGGEVTTVAATLVLAEGSRVIRFHSVDNVSNQEAWQQASYRVDATPPLTTLTVGSPVMRVNGQDVVTPDTPLSLSAQDPLAAGVASGVRSTAYRIDAGAPQAYAGPFHLTAGNHTVYYQSTDNVGNAEAERSVAFAVQGNDSLPPRTTLASQGPSFGSEPLFVSPASAFTLSAVDDRQAVGDAAGVGVASTSWAFDDQAFAAYHGSFAPAAEGSHWLRYTSVDLAGNAEPAHAKNVAVDASAPLSQLSVGSPQALLPDGALVVSSRTLLSISAQDPVAASVASGVSTILSGVDGQALAALSGFFSLPAADGAHTVRYQATDRVGNIEALRSLAVQVDQTAPVTTMSAAPAAYAAADGPILGAAAQLSFAASDPVVNGTAAGVNRIDYALDGGAASPVTATLVLAEGSHSIRYRSVDNVANEEAWRTAAYRVDATAPQTTLVVGSPVMTVSGEEVITPQTPLSLQAQDPVSAGVASGVRSSSYRIDGGESQAYGAPFHLTVGQHTVAYRSTDNAGNAESERSVSFSVQAMDSLPPRTALAVDGASYGSGPVFVASASAFRLSAVDDGQSAGDAAGVGVDSTRWAFDDRPFAAYAGPIAAAAEGSHWLRFYSADKAGNAELSQAVGVAVDASAPASSVAIGAPRATLASGQTVISSSTRLAASAQDPLSAGVASGVAELRLGIDGAAPAAREGSFGLPATDGAHTVSYQAVDHVGNAEPLRTLTVLVDRTAPVTSIAALPEPAAAADGIPWLTPASALTLSAQDPIVNGAAAGISSTELGLDGAAPAPVAAIPSLIEGAHALRYRSVDNVGNTEAWREAAYRVDATAPRTTLEAGFPVMTVSGREVVTPETPISLVAEDPSSGGVASGVRATTYAVDDGAALAYAAPLHLSVGQHTVRYRSADNAGNLEAERSVSFSVEAMDTVAPRTALDIDGARHGSAPVFVSPSSSLRLSAVDDRQTAGDQTGVGVDSTRWAFDDAPFAAYAGPVAPAAEGSHWFRYYSVDNAGNAETIHTDGVAVDASAPISSITIGAPQATLANGDVVIASHTLLAASAADPSMAGVASGVSELRVGIDGAPLAAREGLFMLPPSDGAHTLRFQAVDNVGNIEGLRSLTVLVDQTAPRTSLSMSPEPAAGADGAAYLTASSVLTLAAEDPVINGAAAGVLRTELGLDGAAPLAAAPSLSEGTHTLRYRSVDNVGNAEAWLEASVRVDATAPRTTLETGSPVMRLSGEDVLTPQTPLTLAAEDPVGGGVASGLRSTAYRIDDGPEQAYGGVFTLELGRHAVRYWSTDRAGNAEAEQSAVFSVETLDRLPPRTALEISGARYGDDPMFITPSATFALGAIDDRSIVGDAAGAGVATTSWAFDDEPFSPYQAALPAPAPGSHWLRFYSADRLGNTEAAAAMRLAVDGAAPVSSLSIGAPQAVLASGDVVVASHTELSASAQDPLVAGVASGVAGLRVGIDGGPLVPVTAAFRLPAVDGAHAVARQATDNLGNVEPAASLQVFLDRTAPMTSVSVSPAPFEAADGPILGAAALVAFAAADPEVNGTAAGVHHTEYALDGGDVGVVTGSLALDEGSHTLRARSVDNVGNAEAWRETGYRVDATPPLTTLETGSPVIRLFGHDLITPQTPLSLSAQDPVSAGVASGVGSIAYRVDGGGSQAYAGPFRLAAGSHVVSYRSTDNAGNVEEERSASFEVGGFPSDSVAALDSVSLGGGAAVAGDIRANGAFSAVGKSAVTGDVTAATVDLTGKSTISGTITRAGGTVSAVDLSALHGEAAAANDDASVPWLTGGALTLNSHAAKTLLAGSYFVSGLDLSGGATLSVSGPVRLFVAGPISVTGGAAINSGGAADDLWVLTDGGEVKLAGGARTAMHLIAPNAAVAFSGGGDMAGRVLGRTVSFTGHSSHPSDVTLPAATRPPGQAKKLAKAAAGGTPTAGKAKGRHGEEAVASSRLESESPSTPALAASSQASSPRPLETLAVPTPAVSKIAASARREPSAVASRRDGALAKAQSRGPEAREARTESSQPAAPATFRSAKAGMPPLDLDRLPIPPAHAGRFEKLSRHEPPGDAAAPGGVKAVLESKGPAVVEALLAEESPTSSPLGRSSAAARPALGLSDLTAQPSQVGKFGNSSRHEPQGLERPARPEAQALARAASAQARLGSELPNDQVAGRDARAEAPAIDASRLPPPPPAERRVLDRYEHAAGSPAQARRPEPRPQASADAVRERRHDFEPPAEGRTERESRAEAPAIARERLPESPRGEGGVRTGWTHAGKAEPVERPSASEGRGTASPATQDGVARAVATAELGASAPGERALGRETWNRPGTSLEALPPAPAGRAVLASFRHESDSAALPRRAAESGAGTAGPAATESGNVEVRAASLEPSVPAQERSLARAPLLAPETRAAPAGRSVPARLPPLRLARAAALSLVTPTQTRTLRSPGRSGVTVPEGAVKASLALTVAAEERVEDHERDRREKAAQRRDQESVGLAVSYGPEGTRFEKPVTLELAYDRAKLPAGMSERLLAVHYWNPRAGEWEPLSSEVDVKAQVVRAQTSHFSTYQLLAPASVGAAARPDGLLGEVYPYPNPVRPGQTARLRINSGADRIEVRIYDVSGELKQSAAYDHPAAELDHVWDVSGVGSGIYVYTITATRAGEPTARARGKLGVIR